MLCYESTQTRGSSLEARVLRLISVCPYLTLFSERPFEVQYRDFEGLKITWRPHLQDDVSLLVLKRLFQHIGQGVLFDENQVLLALFSFAAHAYEARLKVRMQLNQPGRAGRVRFYQTVNDALMDVMSGSVCQGVRSVGFDHELGFWRGFCVDGTTFDIAEIPPIE